MRKALLSAVALMLVPSLALAQNITNSKHDFSTTNTGNAPYNTAPGQCIYCHTPHNGTTDAPLWNHETDNTGFQMYSSATLDATAPTAPALVSLACLGCHDGTIGVDSYGGNTPLQNAGGTADSLLVGINTASALLGKDLTNDHPISIQYNQPTADFNNPDADGIIDPGGVALPLYGATATKDQVECGSCHNPHEPNAGVTPSDKFLRDNEASICTVCHIK